MILMPESIYCLNNPYGYLINVNHPKILPLYNRFLKWKKIPQGDPPSDEERREFDGYILRLTKANEYLERGDLSVR